MGFIQSALTPAGTNARQSQVDQQKNATQGAQNALTYLNPLMGQQAGFASSLEPGREADVKRMLYLSSPGNTQAREAIYARTAASNAGLASKEAGASESAQGLSPSYQAGNDVAEANNAASASNAYDQQLESPEYQLQQANSLAGQYQTDMGIPSQSAYNSAVNTIYGRPQVPVAPGIGSVIGGIAGKVAGDYADNAINPPQDT